MTEVRIAGASDFPEVWRLFLHAHEENGMFPISSAKAEWHIKRALEPEKIHPEDTGVRGVIGVIGEPNKLEGGVFLTIGSFWYTDRLHVEEYTLLVDPEHRRSNHAKTLINWMKSQANEVKLPLLTGILSNHRTEAKVRLYERMLPKSGAFLLVKPEYN